MSMQKSKPVPAKVKLSASKTAKKQVPTAWKDRISPEDYEQIRDIFLIFDEDGSGSVDPQEIVKVLQDLGLANRNPYVLSIVWALREQNKILNFDDFVDVVCQKTGDCKTRDGIKRVFDMYDKKQTGEIGFQQFKDIIKFIGENMTDEEILEMMHSAFITKKTESNERFTFDEFYQVISQKYNKHH